MKIASFNAQSFRLRKAQDPDVQSTLIKVRTSPSPRLMPFSRGIGLTPLLQYDRGDFCADGLIVVYGDDMRAAVVPNSAKPFDFHKEFCTTEEMALEVSDHYPVEVELCEASLFWMTGGSQSCDNPDASVIRADANQLNMEVVKLQKENMLQR